MDQYPAITPAQPRRLGRPRPIGSTAIVAVLVAVLGLLAAPLGTSAARHAVRGEIAVGDTTIVVDAAGTPRNAEGRVVFKVEQGGTFKADVICLKVDGNRASIAGKFRRPIFSEGFRFTHFLAIVEDNGPTVDAPLDGWSAQPFTSRPPDCRTFLEGGAGPVTGGDIRVR
jgi:hypothetical protein